MPIMTALPPPARGRVRHELGCRPRLLEVLRHHPAQRRQRPLTRLGRQDLPELLEGHPGARVHRARGGTDLSSMTWDIGLLRSLAPDAAGTSVPAPAAPAQLRSAVQPAPEH